jgi:hypothetical protein
VLVKKKHYLPPQHHPRKTAKFFIMSSLPVDIRNQLWIYDSDPRNTNGTQLVRTDMALMILLRLFSGRFRVPNLDFAVLGDLVREGHMAWYYQYQPNMRQRVRCVSSFFERKK